MNLLQTIIGYYHGETKHGFLGAIIGGILLISGLLLLKGASPFSLLKGLSVPMLLFGLLLGIGGGADGIHTRKTTVGKIALYQKDPNAFLKEEKVKVEKTHRGWRGIRIFWGVLGLSGLVLSALIRKPFWIGAGLGTIALAIIISLFEFYSMRFNERYYQAIQSATAQTADVDTKEINTNNRQRLRMQPAVIEPRISNHERAIGTGSALSPQILPFDSLKNLPALGITTDIRTDSVNLNTPAVMKLPGLKNDVAQVYLGNKKKKVLDYYKSNLIRPDGVNTKHCWFSKKYIKESK